jgi:hypothetical protein
MERRKFVIGIAAVVAVSAIPIINYRFSHLLPGSYLMRPMALANFCDGATIRDIGLCYRHEVPEENERKKLEELLLRNNEGIEVDPKSNDKVICDLLGNKINHEFKSGQTVIENGWVLSETEARQCALFSFSE